MSLGQLQNNNNQNKTKNSPIVYSGYNFTNAESKVDETRLSFSYWKITRGYIFSIIVMLYIFLNINTSTSLTTGAFAWIYYLFLLGGINYDKRVN